MARASIDKPYATFVGGLVTEATGLSYPENSAREAVNLDFSKSGLVRRRLGLSQEKNQNVRTLPLTTYSGEKAQTCYVWKAPVSADSVQFVVIQLGNLLYIYNYKTDEVMNSAELSGILGTTVQLKIANPGGVDFNRMDVQTYRPFDENGVEIYSAGDTELYPFQYAEVNGSLVITSQAILPIVLSYDQTTTTVSLTTVSDSDAPAGSYTVGRYRDFQGVDDGTTVDNRPAVLTPEHLYNLLNAGWKEVDIQAYFTANAVYPSRAQDWKAGKDASNNFSVSELDKVDFGNTPAPIGRKLINLDGAGSRTYTFNAAALPSAPFASPVNLTTSTHDHFRTGMPLTCVGYSGRLFVAGDVCQNYPNAVYFSKVVQKIKDFGHFYQEADPTSENVSDLIDSDGGVLFIPEAGRIRKLAALGDGVVAFCDNGVWYIRGGDSGFRATAYAVDKISAEKIVSPDAVVEAEDAVFFWSTSGIYFVDVTSKVNKLSDKIESFFSAINEEQQATVWGSYDPFNRRLVWSYADKTLAAASVKGKLPLYLIYDIVTQSFTTYEVEAYDNGGTFDVYPGPHFPTYRQLFVIARDPSSALVNDIIRSTTRNTALAIKAVTIQDDGANVVTFGLTEFSNVNFVDWLAFYDANTVTFELDGVNYRSRLVTGTEVMGAPQVDKSVKYVHSFFNRTELGAIFTSADPQEFEYLLASGCFMRVLYDFHESSSPLIEIPRGSKFQQAYRPRRGLPIQNGGGVGSQASLTNTDTVVYSKLKARGHGRSISIQYESEDGKDFQLLGFAVQAAGNTL